MPGAFSLKDVSPGTRAPSANLAGMTTSPRKPTHRPVALAACNFELPVQVGETRVIDIQLTPAGFFKPRDGRKLDVPGWFINADTAPRVIERFGTRQTPVVVDYEHQTLHKETNGQPAPAAAWMRALQWREGSGLWASVELTDQAAEQIRTGAYRFVSPVFLYHETTGEVLSIEMAAITNTPAIDGMQAMELRAAASFAFHSESEEESPMTLLNAVRAALGLPETASEADAIAACSALPTRLSTLQSLTTALGAEESGAVAACSALQHKATASPDPAKYVPVAVVEGLHSQIAALSATNTAAEVTALVDAGLADGRILPAQKDWATDLGKSNIAALSTYLAKTPAIPALARSQTQGNPPPESKDQSGLTPTELAVCSQTGISPADFAAAKPTT